MWTHVYIYIPYLLVLFVKQICIQCCLCTVIDSQVTPKVIKQQHRNPNYKGACLTRLKAQSPYSVINKKRTIGSTSKNLCSHMQWFSMSLSLSQDLRKAQGRAEILHVSINTDGLLEVLPIVLFFIENNRQYIKKIGFFLIYQ